MCLYCRCRRIYEDKTGRCAAQVSRRSHRCKRNKFTVSLQLGTQVYSDASSILIIPDAKAAVDREWENFEKILAWQLTKVRNKKEVIEEARNKGRKVHFASLMNLCHLKSSELEPQYPKYNGRVAPR